MCGWQVKLCDDPLVTREPYLSALEIRSLYIKRNINSHSLLYFLRREAYLKKVSGVRLGSFQENLNVVWIF